MQTKLDRFGRVVIPKEIRDHFGLGAGSALEVAETAEGILYKPVTGEPNLAVRDGVLVYTGTAQADLADAVETHRRRRLDSLTSSPA